MRRLKNMTPCLSLIISIALISYGAPASAQVFGTSDQSRADQNYITVYEDCDFRGNARGVPPGEYRDMRAVQIGNDRISSIRVPRGLEVTIYQDDRFGGFSTTLDRDVACLESAWNDEISSLRVKSNGKISNGRNGFYTNNGVNGRNVSRVEFESLILEKTASLQWRLTDNRGRTSVYRELSKNDNAVYLQGDRNDERIRVDFFTKDVTILARNRRAASYPISQGLRANENYLAAQTYPVNGRTVGRQISQAPVNQSATVRGSCFDYTAYTNGGDGGVRFEGHQGFIRFSKKPHTGRLCHNGSLKFEMNKRNAATDLVVDIQGNRYRFAPNEKATQYLSNWYRKEVTIQVRP